MENIVEINTLGMSYLEFKRLQKIGLFLNHVVSGSHPERMCNIHFFRDKMTGALIKIIDTEQAQFNRRLQDPVPSSDKTYFDKVEGVFKKRLGESNDKFRRD